MSEFQIFKLGGEHPEINLENVPQEKTFELDLNAFAESYHLANTIDNRLSTILNSPRVSSDILIRKLRASENHDWQEALSGLETADQCRGVVGAHQENAVKAILAEYARDEKVINLDRAKKLSTRLLIKFQEMDRTLNLVLNSIKKSNHK